MPTLAELEAQGTIEPVVADRATGELELATAEKHLASASKLAGDDPTLAYAALYDATRKAISAHMRTRGYRATGGPGHHAKTMAYAAAALTGQGASEALSQLDRLRRLRNGSEYRAQSITSSQVEADLAVATSIVEAVGQDLA